MRDLRQNDLIDTAGALGLLRSAVRVAGSQRAFAADCGVSEQFLSDVLNQKRAITDSIAGRIGLRRVVRYQILERQNAG